MHLKKSPILWVRRTTVHRCTGRKHKGLRTHPTLEWLFASVYTNVAFKILLATKRFVTVFAFVRQIASVNLYMVVKNNFLNKGFATNIANESSFAHMYSLHVCISVYSLYKGHVADIAFVSPGNRKKQKKKKNYERRLATERWYFFFIRQTSKLHKYMP